MRFPAAISIGCLVGFVRSISGGEIGCHTGFALRTCYARRLRSFYVFRSTPLLLSDTFEIVHSGDNPSDIDGSFEGFVAPSINSVGAVVFKARLFNTSDDNLNDSGIYRFQVPAGIGPFVVSLQEVAREGETLVAGGMNYTLDDLFLSSFRLEDAPLSPVPVTGLFSKLALQLRVRSGNPDGNSILTVESSPVTAAGPTVNLIAAAGEEVPSSNGTFREFNAFTFGDVSPSASVTFFSALNNTDNGTDDNVALFRYRADGSLTELVREGEPANGGAFSTLGSVRNNDIGDFVFIASNDSGDPSSDSGIYRVTANGATPTYIVGEGDNAPSDDTEQRVFRQVSEIRLNNDGVVGFAGVMRAENGFAIQNDSGLYTTSGGAVTEIVREGQLTPDGTATFMNFASTTTGDIPRSPFNDLEQFAFAVDLSLAGGSQISGVFRASEDELIEIAREDDSYEDGTLFNFADPALNNQGLVAFQASLALGTEVGPEGSFTIRDDILILTDGEDYATVARGGQEINGRTLVEIFFNNVATGIANGLSDSGIITYSALYDDGSSAVNVWRPQLGWRSAAGDGIWEDEANWFFNMAPNFASDVQIDAATDVVIQGPVTDSELNSLSFGNGEGDVTFVAGLGSILATEGVNIGDNGTLQVGADAEFVVGGGLNNNGVIELGENSLLTIEGLFSGDGPINGADGTTLFDGQLSPGNSPGLLSIEGNAVLGENNETIIEIAGLGRGTEYDGIDVDGTLTLDGTLNVVLLDGFTLEAGDEFLLIQAANILGAFDIVNLPEIAGLQLFLDFTQSSLSLNVQAVPVPPAAWLFLSTLLILKRQRREIFDN